MKCCPNCGWSPPKVPHKASGVVKDIERIKSLYLEKDTTLQGIADQYGVTREYIRQLLKKHGVAKTSGARSKRICAAKMSRGSELARRKRERYLAKYGCDVEEFEKANDFKSPCDRSSNYYKYRYHKHNARIRGIEFHLSFLQWLAIWGEKIAQRGRGGDLYVMSRKMDTGAYEEGNVEIITCRENTRRYQESLKERGVICPDGYKRLPENEKSTGGKE